MKRSSQMKTRSLSLPGLTSQYITYVQQLLDVLPDKLIICIDELDKITDLDGVRSILREIKGGLYVKGCFYVISLSEDVLQAFGGRLSSTRDIFESTFDEVFSISRLDVESCKKVLERRLEASRPDSCAFGAATEDVMILCAVLSSGIPRDLVRNLRECVLAVANNADPSVHLCWEHLFLRKLVELKNEILTFQEYDDVRAALLEELDLLLSFQIGTPEDLGGILVRLEGTVGQLLSRLVKPSGVDSGDGKNDAAVVPIKGWIRDWIELEIYVLCFATIMSAEKTEKAEALRYVYNLLPYSVERSRAKLKSLFPNGLGEMVWIPDA